jgi:hypothetical protein
MEGYSPDTNTQLRSEYQEHGKCFGKLSGFPFLYDGIISLHIEFSEHHTQMKL